MTGVPVKSVVTPPDEEIRLRRQIYRLEDRIHQRAIEIHHRHANSGPDCEEIRQAEREVALCHLAGIEENEINFRITASLVDCEPGHLKVNAMRDAVVIEEEPTGASWQGRYSIFSLRSPIDAAGVRAEFAHGDLVITAPKAAR